MARRFVTYNTEDQAAGLVNVDERGVMKPQQTAGGGGGFGTSKLYCQYEGNNESSYLYNDDACSEKTTYEQFLELWNNGLVLITNVNSGYSHFESSIVIGYSTDSDGQGMYACAFVAASGESELELVALHTDKYGESYIPI